jgi:hypothetical protein
MRALTVNELEFVSGGENHRPWNPYENFRDVEPSKKFSEMERLINFMLKEAGLDLWGNLSGTLGDIVLGAIINSDTNLAGVTGIRILDVTSTVTVTYSVEVVVPPTGGVSSGPISVGWSNLVRWLTGR